MADQRDRRPDPQNEREEESRKERQDEVKGAPDTLQMPRPSSKSEHDYRKSDQSSGSE